MTEYSAFAGLFVSLMTEAPDSQLDPVIIEDIKRWSNPPTSKEIIQVMNRCVNGGFSSTIALRSLEMLCSKALIAESQFWRPNE